MEPKRIVIVGATGMVGGCALRICLDDPAVAAVTVTVRRSTGIEHAGLHGTGGHEDPVLENRDIRALAR